MPVVYYVSFYIFIEAWKISMVVLWCVIFVWLKTWALLCQNEFLHLQFLLDTIYNPITL